MKVMFGTKIKEYKTNCFPNDLEIPPRIGETVLVSKVFFDYFSIQNLPMELEVVDVIWTEECVICELYYKKKYIESVNNAKIDYSTIDLLKKNESVDNSLIEYLKKIDLKIDFLKTDFKTLIEERDKILDKCFLSMINKLNEKNEKL